MDRKAKAGATHRFVWTAPKPIASPPSLVVGGVSYELEALCAPVAVEGDHQDLRRLIADEAPAQASAGKYGRGWLVTLSDGAFPVLVAAVDGAELALAEPLPRAVGPGTLQWATWAAVLPAMPAQRNLRWEVAYELAEVEAFEEPGQVDVGLLHVVDVPFRTGLTHEGFASVFPRLRDAHSRGHQDLGAVIDFAEEILASRLRALLAPRGLTEDDVKSAQALRPAHAHLVASLLVEDGAALQARAYELAEEALRAVWLDLDGDGQVTPGEAPAAVSGPIRIAPTFYAEQTDRRFSRGQAR